ncbi:hypothetical protein BKA67DRAFT_679296 [Truncatella angustata]|uniref:Uncharacterized protein n=1 Tax=Truncatella angustata TaxID=152316 RepID=A0A9P8UK21_9PEZI|nr:uncharacterized protein BKA67DRAFT_679296 [Truncatella angustata]KAH6653557.1 hypothetical protein BKA67DRAFT_679296 [Truncatella angustata]
MEVSPGLLPSITVRGDATTLQRPGRVLKPRTKIRLVQQTGSRSNANELSTEVKELSKLVQDLLQRVAEKE